MHSILELFMKTHGWQLTVRKPGTHSPFDIKFEVVFSGCNFTKYHKMWPACTLTLRAHNLICISWHAERTVWKWRNVWKLTGANIERLVFVHSICCPLIHWRGSIKCAHRPATPSLLKCLVPFVSLTVKVYDSFKPFSVSCTPYS